MYFLGSSLLFTSCAFFYVTLGLNAASVAYIGRRNEYFDITPIQRFETRSAVECNTMCDQHETCVATNTNRNASECELLTQRPQVREDFVTKQNWTLFVKSEYNGEEWVNFNQSYFLPVKDRLDWYHADGLCLTLGTELVHIHSSDEHTFVFNLLTSHGMAKVWIGLNDIVEEGRFRWSAGRSVTYKAFYPWEPNDAGNQDCVVNCDSFYGIENGWDDVPCTYRFPLICKKSSY